MSVLPLVCFRLRVFQFWDAEKNEQNLIVDSKERDRRDDGSFYLLHSGYVRVWIRPTRLRNRTLGFVSASLLIIISSRGSVDRVVSGGLCTHVSRAQCS